MAYIKQTNFTLLTIFIVSSLFIQAQDVTVQITNIDDLMANEYLVEAPPNNTELNNAWVFTKKVDESTPVLHISWTNPNDMKGMIRIEFSYDYGVDNTILFKSIIGVFEEDLRTGTSPIEIPLSFLFDYIVPTGSGQKFDDFRMTVLKADEDGAYYDQAATISGAALGESLSINPSGTDGPISVNGTVKFESEFTFTLLNEPILADESNVDTLYIEQYIEPPNVYVDSFAQNNELVTYCKKPSDDYCLGAIEGNIYNIVLNSNTDLIKRDWQLFTSQSGTLHPILSTTKFINTSAEPNKWTFIMPDLPSNWDPENDFVLIRWTSYDQYGRKLNRPFGETKYELKFWAGMDPHKIGIDELIPYPGATVTLGNRTIICTDFINPWDTDYRVTLLPGQVISKNHNDYEDNLGHFLYTNYNLMEVNAFEDWQLQTGDYDEKGYISNFYPSPYAITGTPYSHTDVDERIIKIYYHSVQQGADFIHIVPTDTEPGIISTNDYNQRLGTFKEIPYFGNMYTHFAVNGTGLELRYKRETMFGTSKQNSVELQKGGLFPYDQDSLPCNTLMVSVENGTMIWWPQTLGPFECTSVGFPTITRPDQLTVNMGTDTGSLQSGLPFTIQVTLPDATQNTDLWFSFWLKKGNSSPYSYAPILATPTDVSWSDNDPLPALENYVMVPNGQVFEINRFFPTGVTMSSDVQVIGKFSKKSPHNASEVYSFLEFPAGEEPAGFSLECDTAVSNTISTLPPKTFDSFNLTLNNVVPKILTTNGQPNFNFEAVCSGVEGSNLKWVWTYQHDSNTFIWRENNGLWEWTPLVSNQSPIDFLTGMPTGNQPPQGVGFNDAWEYVPSTQEVRINPTVSYFPFKNGGTLDPMKFFTPDPSSPPLNEINVKVIAQVLDFEGIAFYVSGNDDSVHEVAFQIHRASTEQFQNFQFEKTDPTFEKGQVARIDPATPSTVEGFQQLSIETSLSADVHLCLFNASSPEVPASPSWSTLNGWANNDVYFGEEDIVSELNGLITRWTFDLIPNLILDSGVSAGEYILMAIAGDEISIPTLTIIILPSVEDRLVVRFHYNNHIGTSSVSQAYSAASSGVGGIPSENDFLSLNRTTTETVIEGYYQLYYHVPEFTYFDPYGDIIPSTSVNNSDNPRYTDHERDSDTGLNYMKGRFQLATYAKFNRPDPMRDWNWLRPHTLNLYEYVGNDPVNAWDPTGLRLKDIGLHMAVIWSGAAAATVGLLADDVTVIGIANDPAILGVAVVAVDLSILDIVYNVLDEAIHQYKEFREADPIGSGTSEMSDNKDGQPGPALPDDAWNKNAPDQMPPGTGTLDHNKYNPKTGELEQSTVEYDQYGRQKKREDETDHGYTEDHTNPHTHEREFGPGYGPKGKETRSDQKPKDGKKVSNKKAPKEEDLKP